MICLKQTFFILYIYFWKIIIVILETILEAHLTYLYGKALKYFLCLGPNEFLPHASMTFWFGE